VNWPQPTRSHHEQFCKAEEWERVRNARGKSGSHHATYELELPDGRILRTRISHPVDRTGYGPAIWSHILRDQLGVAEQEFWACVLDGVLPDRGTPRHDRESLPADLVHLLIHRVGLSDDEVSAMSKAEAIARVQEFWMKGD